MSSLSQAYNRACHLAERGEYAEARALFLELREKDGGLDAQVANSLGVLAAVEGDEEIARAEFIQAIQFDSDCAAARDNLALLGGDSTENGNADDGRTRVAILSFLFNWPSTGGGIIHTVELAKFLEQAGYEVRLMHPVFAPWQIGRVREGCPYPTHGIRFEEPDWTIAGIQDRFRETVDAFAPDQVIITDSWNFKPHLARAVEGYSYLLRMQALECLCPLNNLRLLLDEEGRPRQCGNTQLKAPARCRRCVSDHEPSSGGLHRLDRHLSEFHTVEYERELRWAMEHATAVLVLNSAVRDLYAAHCDRVRVVTWGMDGSRFPWPPPDDSPLPPSEKARLLFAGLTEEPIKGFSVVNEACRRLWQRRQDFELVVTAVPDAAAAEYMRYVGWQSQADLPALYRACQATLVPTIAQEGLSRTAVEAMASGRAVIGSRIGGLPDTIVENVTGLFAEPGDIADWTEKIAWLLDHPDERAAMGLAGRKRFEEQYTWERVIREQYAPLLGTPVRAEGER